MFKFKTLFSAITLIISLLSFLTKMWIGPGSYCGTPYGGTTVTLKETYTHTPGYCTKKDPEGGRWQEMQPVPAGCTTTPLPIELLSFTAVSSLNNSIQIDWQTTTETNNDYFTIERSFTLTDWEEIDKVHGAGNSSTILNYNTIDNNPFDGVSYYRLKQTDYDGASSYSKIVPVNLDKFKDFEVYPNPAVDKMTFRGCPEDGSYVLINSVGEIITLNLEVADTRAVLDVTVFEAGLYILEVRTPFGIERRKIVTQ